MRKNLKEARQKAGMTQKQVAEYLGMTERAYQRIENGERLGTIETWDLLEDLFNINQRKLRQISSN
jgi:transcriptional regulator with XRE-family HTH domain